MRGGAYTTPIPIAFQIISSTIFVATTLLVLLGEGIGQGQGQADSSFSEEYFVPSYEQPQHAYAQSQDMYSQQ